MVCHVSQALKTQCFPDGGFVPLNLWCRCARVGPLLSMLCEVLLFSGVAGVSDLLGMEALNWFR